MEYERWKAVNAVLSTLVQLRKWTSQKFSDARIVQVFYWAVICDRPISWACRPKNWPIWLRREPLPSSPTMSKRLKSASVVALLEALERRVIAPKEPGMFWMIDGKPLPIGGRSKDRQAGYGQAAGCKAKGYKVHALIADDGEIAAWRLAPMNKDERVMAERLLKSAPEEVLGYLMADANFDSNRLHQICDARGNLQMVTPRRYGPGRGTGHRKQAKGRLKMIRLTENPQSQFAHGLLHDRDEIERRFGHLTNWGGGLQGLPSWVRTHRRVHRWVQAKLVLTQLKRHGEISTYVAA